MVGRETGSGKREGGEGRSEEVMECWSENGGQRTAGKGRRAASDRRRLAGARVAFGGRRVAGAKGEEGARSDDCPLRSEAGWEVGGARELDGMEARGNFVGAGAVGCATRVDE